MPPSCAMDYVDDGKLACLVCRPTHYILIGYASPKGQTLAELRERGLLMGTALREAQDIFMGPALRKSQEEMLFFEEAMRIYPRRPGNSRTAARQKWLARIRDGVKPHELMSGVKRYADYIRATGSEGTQFVKMATTFFGPGEWWKQEWEKPIDPAQKRKLYRVPDGFLVDPRMSKIRWHESGNGAFTRQGDDGTWHFVKGEVREIWE